MTDRLLALLGDVDGGLDLVRRICELCVTELAVSGAGMSVMTGALADGTQILVHSTGEAGKHLEDLQLTVGEGPSVDAYVSGEAVLVPDLDAEQDRWPAYAPGAAGLGVAAVFSFPLQVGAARLGVLDLYRTTAGPLSAARLSGALTLAEAGTVALLDDADAAQGARLLGQGELHSVVHQATGIVTVQLDVSLQEALIRIRAYAYAHHLSLNEVGGRIVRRELVLGTGE
ncbi:GAF and ANTAR domain-containing protein [Amycolatopsis sp. NPDC057786]|uniref:GAF and ANTAR domain-containing protein n=1 Tax=Amycolatopsis sp. NPDC057786 TaxID=3346250 RepID=UPI00366FFCF7